MRSFEWADKWSVAPSACLVFFAALQEIRGEPTQGSPGEDSLRIEITSSATPRDAVALWTTFLDELSGDASRQTVTVYDLALAAWRYDPRIRDICGSIDYPIENIGTSLTRVLGEPDDEPPPLLPPGKARFAVVIRGDHYVDYSNKYATFEEAQFVLASLSAEYFGTERPRKKLDRPVFIMTKDFVTDPRSIFIQELR